jgi:hypothetical protein
VLAGWRWLLTAHQRDKTQFPAALAANEQMHPVTAYLADRRLMRRQVELPNRDAQTFPTSS